MKITHFYHLFADGHWHLPWQEHIGTIINTGLYEELEEIRIGLVGGNAQRQEALNVVKQYDKVNIAAEANGGYEQVTLNILYDEVMRSEEEFYILYAHTKGAAYQRPNNTFWRRDMTRITVGEWKQSLALLDEGYDATGIFWRRTPELGKFSPVPEQHFSGNFWWTKASYVRTLGPLRNGNRYDAEGWIGYNPAIKFYDLHPGYPQVRFDPGGVNTSIKDMTNGDGKVITLYALSNVMGPWGVLRRGQTVAVTDSSYVQVLIKSGNVIIWEVK